MPSDRIVALMIHVPQPRAALAWYQLAFPSARRVEGNRHLQALQVGQVQLEFVPADDKVRSGSAGTVANWHVPDFDAALTGLQAIGATLYRGPLDIEGSQAMCQVRDPWGNCLGVRGKKVQ